MNDQEYSDHYASWGAQYARAIQDGNYVTTPKPMPVIRRTNWWLVRLLVWVLVHTVNTYILVWTTWPLEWVAGIWAATVLMPPVYFKLQPGKDSFHVWVIIWLVAGLVLVGVLSVLMGGLS